MILRHHALVLCCMRGMEATQKRGVRPKPDPTLADRISLPGYDRHAALTRPAQTGPPDFFCPAAVSYAIVVQCLPHAYPFSLLNRSRRSSGPSAPRPQRLIIPLDQQGMAES